MKKLLILGFLTLGCPFSVWAAPSSETPKCQTYKQVKNTQNPVALTVSMVDCIREDRYSDAVDLFNIAGVFAKYDTLRVADRTAHQAYSVLKMQASQQLTTEQAETFDAQLKSKLGNANYQAQLCQSLNKIGAPTYNPTYMSNHGMSAFTGSAPSQNDNFDGRSAWRDVMTNYLKCEK